MGNALLVHSIAKCLSESYYKKLVPSKIVSFLFIKDYMDSRYCVYYTARIERSLCWFVSSCLRGTEHVSFDRALDVENSIFEFFVPIDMEPVFLQVMDYLEKKQAVSDLTKRENRLMIELTQQ